MGGGESSGAPTKQEQQVSAEQLQENAQLNLEENSQRKSILNAMMGTRVFRGSALSRAVAGNTPGQGGGAAGAPSAAQTAGPITPNAASLLDTRQSLASGATGAGGAGASSNTTPAVTGAQMAATAGIHVGGY